MLWSLESPVIGRLRCKLNFSKFCIADPVGFAGGVLRDSEANWICGFTYRIGISPIRISELWGFIGEPIGEGHEVAESR